MHSGIDFEQLVSELRFGVRLPSPLYCPFEIAQIMRQCFHENPHQRPNFDEVRRSLTQITSALQKAPIQAIQKDNVNSDMSVRYSDLAMESSICS